MDPIPQLARTARSPFFWQDVAQLMKTTAAQDAFLEDLKAAGISNGLALQVYGPNLRNGYVGLGFHPDAARARPELVFQLQCVAQIGHLRYCALTPQDADPEQHMQELTPRAVEVLQWIAHGKSNSVSADILGVSRHTIDTLVRRMFHKMGVQDRTTAALRGVGSGLILS